MQSSPFHAQQHLKASFQPHLLRDNPKCEESLQYPQLWPLLGIGGDMALDVRIAHGKCLVFSPCALVSRVSELESSAVRL